jgi:hypothetical protein
MSLAPTNLAELEVMIEFVELKARVPRATKDFKEKKRQLKMLVRDKGMAKGMRRAALKEKRGEIRELKSLRADLKRQIKAAGQSMAGIVTLTYLKRKKKKITAKVCLPNELLMLPHVEFIAVIFCHETGMARKDWDLIKHRWIRKFIYGWIKLCVFSALAVIFAQLFSNLKL